MRRHSVESNCRRPTFAGLNAPPERRRLAPPPSPAQVAGATVEETGRLRQVRRFASAGEAAAALEYAILVGIAAVATIVVLAAFTGDIGTAMDQIATNLKGTADKTGK